MQLYADAGIHSDRLLIKIAATWEGIRAAQVLERDGHQCVMTGKTRMLEAHHIDHDPTNNVLTNLISLSRPAHEFYHSLRAGPQAALRSWFEEKVK